MVSSDFSRSSIVAERNEFRCLPLLFIHQPTLPACRLPDIADSISLNLVIFRERDRAIRTELDRIFGGAAQLLALRIFDRS
jgi:hypothetical protein